MESTSLPIGTVVLIILVTILAGTASTQNEQWLDVQKENIRPAILGISGMALSKETRDGVSLMVVHDNKRDNEPRVGIVKLRQNQDLEYTTLEWPGALPIDFEAIGCRAWSSRSFCRDDFSGPHICDSNQ